MTLTCTEPPTSLLADIGALYSAGRILSAYRRGEEFAPLAQWRGPAGRVLAGRILQQLGAHRLGRSLHLRAFREHPTEPRVAYFYAYAVLNRRGPLAAMRFQREFAFPADAPATVRADWLAFAASTSAIYRDFESAEDRMAQAEALKTLDRLDELCPVRERKFFQGVAALRSHVAYHARRFDEAIAFAEQADNEFMTKVHDESRGKAQRAGCRGKYRQARGARLVHQIWSIGWRAMIPILGAAASVGFTGASRRTKPAPPRR